MQSEAYFERFAMYSFSASRSSSMRTNRTSWTEAGVLQIRHVESGTMRCYGELKLTKIAERAVIIGSCAGRLTVYVISCQSDGQPSDSSIFLMLCWTKVSKDFMRLDASFSFLDDLIVDSALPLIFLLIRSFHL